MTSLTPEALKDLRKRAQVKRETWDGQKWESEKFTAEVVLALLDRIDELEARLDVEP